MTASYSCVVWTLLHNTSLLIITKLRIGNRQKKKKKRGLDDTNRNSKEHKKD